MSLDSRKRASFEMCRPAPVGLSIEFEAYGCEFDLLLLLSLTHDERFYRVLKRFYCSLF